MGVYYPPQCDSFMGRLDTETAYVVSLVLHTLWGGLGTFWASRRMGISSVGSALAAFSWTTCGFFLIHLAHPWAIRPVAGCPGPGAWHGRSSLRRPDLSAPAFFLSVVLVLQVLPGHFQLASRPSSSSV